MNEPVYYLISIYLHPGKADLLRNYQRQAFGRIGVHGGRVLHALRPDDPGAHVPNEIHLITFPSEAHWQAYLADPVLAPYRVWRDEAVQRTEIVPMHGIPAAEYDTVTAPLAEEQRGES